jgi:hypothetical protein
VWVWPEKERRELGESRWVCEWYTAREGAKEGDNFDWDNDLITHRSAHKTRAAALSSARRRAEESVFGTASVDEQRVEWLDQRDGVGEWVYVGKPEEIQA